MFTNAHYEVLRERYEGLVRDTEHYGLVQAAQAAQPRPPQPVWMFILKIWQRRPHFTIRPTEQKHEPPIRLVATLHK
jgi:hypothetical protein